MNLTKRDIKKEIRLVAQETYTLLHCKEVESLLREGIRVGSREYESEDGERYTYVKNLLDRLKGVIDSKSVEIRNLFTVRDGYLIFMPSGDSGVKIIKNNEEIVGLCLYDSGLVYRLFLFNYRKGYTVSVEDFIKIKGEDLVRERLAAYVGRD